MRQCRVTFSILLAVGYQFIYQGVAYTEPIKTPKTVIASDRTKSDLYSWLGATEEQVLKQNGESPEVDTDREGFDRIYAYYFSQRIRGMSSDKVLFFFKKGICKKVSQIYAGNPRDVKNYPTIKDKLPQSFLKTKPDVSEPTITQDGYGNVTGNPYATATWDFGKDIWTVNIVNTVGRRFNSKTGEYEAYNKPLGEWNIISYEIELRM